MEKKIKPFAVAVTRTVTYVEIVPVKAADKDSALDVALDKTRGDTSIITYGHYLTHRDTGEVLDINV